MKRYRLVGYQQATSKEWVGYRLGFNKDGDITPFPTNPEKTYSKKEVESMRKIFVKNSNTLFNKWYSKIQGAISDKKRFKKSWKNSTFILIVEVNNEK